MENQEEKTIEERLDPNHKYRKYKTLWEARKRDRLRLLKIKEMLKPINRILNQIK